MTTPLVIRERAMARLRELTHPNGWLGQYALLLAYEMLDLHQLNQLLDDVDDAYQTPSAEDRARARLLAVERNHPSRLS